VEIINWKIASHPLNWLIIWVVVFGAGMAYTFIHEGMSNNNQNAVSPD
jgi:hypothetical protein